MIIKINLVLLLLIMVGCAKLPFVTEPTKVEIVDNFNADA